MSLHFLADGFAPFFLVPLFLIGILFFVILVPTEALILRLMNWSSFRRGLTFSLLANVASSAVGFVLLIPLNIDPGKPAADAGFLKLWILALATVVVEGCVLMFANRKNLGLSFSAALATNMASYLLLVWPLLTWLPNSGLMDSGESRGKQKRTMSDLRSIGTAIESYIVDYGNPPVPLQGDVEGIRSPLEPTYIKILPTQDAWKGKFFYQTNGRDSYTIASAGKDGEMEEPLFRDVGPAGRFTCDIVYSNGQFVIWPEGTQN
jgi:type II secretory pathway pseudopilin PulG